MTAARRRSAALALATVLLALVAAWADPAPAAACSCALRSETEYAEEADVIFTGTVTTNQQYAAAQTVTFAVQQVYNGQARSSETVSTLRWGGSCGSDYDEPGPFLVYVTQEAPGLFANLCAGSGTGPAPAGLGPGRPPVADPGSAEPELPASSRRWVPVIGLALAVGGAGAVGWLVLRRRPG